MIKKFYFLFLYCGIGYCQNQKEVNIFDSESLKPIAYVSIYRNDTLFTISNKNGTAIIENNLKFLFKKDDYYDFYGDSENIFLERINENEILNEIVIYTSKKNTIKKLGNIEAYAFPVENLEFKTFVVPTIKEINRSINKISFKLKYLNKTKKSDILFKLYLYDSVQQLIYTDFIELDFEKDTLDFFITKNILFDKNGVYIGIEMFNLNNSINSSVLLAFDLFYSKKTSYKRNY